MPKSLIASQKDDREMPETYRQLLQDFRETLGLDWQPPADLARAAQAAIAGCAATLDEQKARRQRLLTIVNQKFRLNNQRFQGLLDAAASRRVFLNYHEKVALRTYLDQGDSNRLRTWLKHSGLPDAPFTDVEPISPTETLRQLDAQLQAPRISRRDARASHPSERRQEILRALFGSYVFSAFPPRAMHQYFNADCGIQ